ncbi:hypothetical protein XELAEV_18028599mg [Xenopus laevis]|uniref:Uncharacterized protein n=1 Tax=Xenopus laevis TaxID=8355 RepID=A0A974HGT7_XENLA|nr:hypothetical protein XELAEV_18028599mg [Xenopus laevis]
MALNHSELSDPLGGQRNLKNEVGIETPSERSANQSIYSSLSLGYFYICPLLKAVSVYILCTAGSDSLG